MSLFKKSAEKPSTRSETTGERRQLTVLFYDIVGSTSLVDDNDPETLREALNLIHAAARTAITNRGGSLQQIMGDGGMAYFGFPNVDEDAALSAVSAALELIEARDEIAAAPNMRIGIATSMVVLPERNDAVATGHLGAVGVAPNLAARLEAACAINTILVGPATHTLTYRAFEYEPVDGLRMKGFPDVTKAWRPLSRRRQLSRFARDRDGSTSFAGRDTEIETLRTAWKDAIEGRGRAILIEGEPGIGKSRIVSELSKSAVDGRTVVLQCQPRTGGDALFAITRMYDNAYEADEDAELVNAAIQTAESLHELEDDYTLSPDVRRDAILTSVVGAFQRLATDQPLLLLAEDLHWADEVTLAVLRRLAQQAAQSCILVVGTMRPTKGLDDVSHAFEKLALSPMDHDVAHALVDAHARVDLPDETRTWIVNKADGNPLFLTELTAFANDAPDTSEHAFGIDAISIESLNDLLATRLESAGVAKRTAQIASVVGRESPHHLLTKLAHTYSPEELDADLQRLIDHGLKELVTKDDVYMFRHALVKDVAYNSQLRAARNTLHGRIVDLVDADPRFSTDVPNILLAEHCFAAGRFERGIALMLDVAEDAIRRSALRAPRTMLERILILTSELDEASCRDGFELRAISLLGPLVTLLDGPRSAASLYDKGQALYFNMEPAERSQYFSVLWGWWFTASDLVEQTRRSEILIRDVTPQADAESRLQALHCGWATLFDRGAHDRCLHNISDGLVLYEPETGQRSRYLYGHDAKVCGLGERALCGWLTGQLEMSAKAISDCEAWADGTAHLPSQLHGLDIATQVAFFNHDIEGIERILGKMERLSDADSVPAITAKRQIFRGWMAVRAGDKGRADAVTSGLAALRGFGVLEDTPFYADIAADVFARCGDVARALGPLEEEIEEARRTGLTYWLPELLRRKARLTTDARADTALDEGFEIAQSQNAKMLALRNIATRLDIGRPVPVDHAKIMRETIANISDCALRQKVMNALAE